MRIILITQKDPFYLAKNIDYLINRIGRNHKIVGCVLFDVSPFGKRESFLNKAKRTINVFGPEFFIYYSARFLLNKFNPNKNVARVLYKHKIPLITLAKRINHSDSLKMIADYEPDLLISIAGNQIFKKPLLELAPKGCINLHTALLPKYRGLMPTFWVLKNNEKETGVSVFIVDEGIDSGPIIVQKNIVIEPKETQRSLILRSKKIGMDAIAEAVELIDKDDLDLIPNPEEEMSYFSFPTRKDVNEFKKAGKKFF
jgi:methionyl-tRNA formyltransferase